MRVALSIVLLVAACTKASNNATPSGSNAPARGSAPIAAEDAPQISVDAPDPVVAVDAAAPADAAAKADAKPDATPAQLVQCGADSDCVLTMIPAEPACCRQLCNPRAIARSTLPGLQAKQDARDCKAVLCAPPAPCPRAKAVKPVCERGACVAR